MTVADLIIELLHRADTHLPGASTVTADEASMWPAGSIDELLQSGLLVRSQPTATVTCDACFEEHCEGVQFVESPSGAPARAYIACPEAGRVAVDVGRLARWHVDPGSIARALTGLMGSRDEPLELVRDRLWDIGSCHLGGIRYEMLLARGLTWPDAPDSLALSQFGNPESTVILALATVPDPPLPFAVVPLTRALSLHHQHLVLDWDALAVTTAQARNSLASGRAPAAEQVDPHVPVSANVFRKEGEYWTVAYEGRSTRLKDSKGLHYIAALLERQGRQFHVLELVNTVEKHGVSGITGQVAGAAHRADEEGLRAGGMGHADEVLDPQAIAEYKAELRNLQEQLDEAMELGDTERTETIQASMDQLTDALKAATGIGQRARRTGSPVERARVNVTKQINNALRRIEIADKAIASALRPAITTGAFCAYSPSSPVVWTF